MPVRPDPARSALLAALDARDVDELRRDLARAQEPQEPQEDHADATPKPDAAAADAPLNVQVADALLAGLRVEITVAGAVAGAPRRLRLRGPVRHAVRRMLAALVAGEPVEVRATSGAREIGTERIARLLGVTRPTAVALLDRGTIASRRTPGGHRRARVADVLAYEARRARERRSIAELVAHAQEHEMPELTPAWMRSEDPDGDDAVGYGQDAGGAAA